MNLCDTRLKNTCLLRVMRSDCTPTVKIMMPRKALRLEGTTKTNSSGQPGGQRQTWHYEECMHVWHRHVGHHYCISIIALLTHAVSYRNDRQQPRQDPRQVCYFGAIVINLTE